MWAALGAWVWARKWFILPAVVVSVALGILCIVLAVRLHAAKVSADALADQLTGAQVVQQLAPGQASEYMVERDNLIDYLAAENEALRKQVPAGAKVVTVVQTQIVYRRVTVDVPGTVTTVPGAAGAPPALRVDFKADEGFVHLAGYTLTDPAGAHLDWQFDPLALDVVVIRDKSGRYRAIFDTHDPRLRLDAARTAIDPSAMDVQKRWYVAASAGVGIPDWKNLALGVDAGYQFDAWSLGLAYAHTGTDTFAGGHHLGLRVGVRF